MRPGETPTVAQAGIAGSTKTTRHVPVACNAVEFSAVLAEGFVQREGQRQAADAKVLAGRAVACECAAGHGGVDASNEGRRAGRRATESGERENAGAEVPAFAHAGSCERANPLNGASPAAGAEGERSMSVLDVIRPATSATPFAGRSAHMTEAAGGETARPGCPQSSSPEALRWSEIEQVPAMVLNQETHFGPVNDRSQERRPRLHDASHPRSSSVEAGPQQAGVRHHPLRALETLLDAGAGTASASPAPAPDKPGSSGGLVTGSIAAQVFDPVRTSLASAVEEATATRNPQDPAAAPSGPILRVVKLQLVPESLGLVNVVLAKDQASLSVRLEVELPEVAERLELERSGLAERVTAAGYAVGDIVIDRMQVVAHEAGEAASQARSGVGSSHGVGDAMANGGRSERQADHERHAGRQRGEPEPPVEPIGRRDDGALLVAPLQGLRSLRSI